MVRGYSGVSGWAHVFVIFMLTFAVVGRHFFGLCSSVLLLLCVAIALNSCVCVCVCVCVGGCVCVWSGIY